MKNRIDYWRGRQRMTYQSIADAAGMTPQYVSMLAKGQRCNPGLVAMRRISLALGKRVDQVFPTEGGGA